MFNDSFTNLTNAPVDVVYTVVPFSAAGCEGESFTVTATVNPEPIVENQVLTVCSDELLALTLGNDIDGPLATTYNITSIVRNGLVASAGSPVVANGVLASVLEDDTWTNMTPLPVDVVYTIVPVSGAGCLGDSFTVTITVNPEPVVANQTLTVCSDALLDLTLGADVNTPVVTSYEIVSISSGGLTSSSGNPVVGVNLPSSDLLDDAWTNLGSVSVNVVYTVIATGDNGCKSNPFTVTITVTPEPVVANQTVTICSDAPVSENFNSSSSVGATSYNVINLELNGLVVNSGGVAIANDLLASDLFNDSFTNLTNAPVDVVYTVVPVTALGCEGTSFTVTATVEPRPLISDKDFEICSGDLFNYMPLNNEPLEIVPVGTTFSWTFLDNTNILGEINGNNETEFFQPVLLNITNINQVVVYEVTAISGTCSFVFEIELTIKPTPYVPYNSGLTDTRCSGDTFVIAPQNGVPDMLTIVPLGTTYTWTVIDNPNVTGDLNQTNPQTSISQTLINLTNINQSIEYIVTPYNGECQGQDFSVTAWVEPRPFISNVFETLCDNESLIFAPVNGIFPDTNTIIPDLTLYSWMVQDVGNGISGHSDGLNQPFIDTGVLSNDTNTVQTLIYTVTPTYYVISNPGVPQCIGNDFTITITLNPSIDDNAVITNIDCSYSQLCGGAIEINPVGIAPFTYQWSFVGTQINGITDPTAQNQFNLCPGDYHLDITDAAGCTYGFDYVIVPPLPVSFTLQSIVDISCNNNNSPACDGYIEVQLTGGTAPYVTLEWYKEAVAGSAIFNVLVGLDSPILNNACEGNYVLEVTDSNGCQFVSPIYTVQNLFNQITVLEDVSNYNGFQVACSGGNSGFINTTISGGSGTYTYEFSNTAGVIQSGNLVVPNPPTPPGSVDLNFNNLTAGTYQLIISDPFCPNNVIKTFVLSAPPVLDSFINLTSLPIQCFNGTATYEVTATGGVIPYSGIGTYTFAAGVHTIEVTDANGCMVTEVITVTQPTELELQAIVSSPILCNGGTGEITISAIGGTPAYTGTGIFTVTAGNYIYFVYDANGCSKSISISISEPDPISFVVDSVINPNCDPDRSYSNGSICITVDGGINSFPIGTGWVNTTANQWCLNNLTEGSYTIQVTDVNNCDLLETIITLTRPTELTAFVNSNTLVDCNTQTVEQYNYVFASGGTPPYYYSWSGGDECDPINPQCMTTEIEGIYSVFVNDQEGIDNGCPPVEVQFNVDLIEIGEPFFTFDSFTLSTCGTLAINDPITFTNESTGDYSSIKWYIEGQLVSVSENFDYEFEEVDDYIVTIEVEYEINGIICSYSYSESLAITIGYDLIIPTAFTPNNDGINETIRPVFNCMESVKMSIYDTWGSLIYVEAGADLLGWNGKIDGKDAENGNYIIVVEATTFAGKVVTVNGPITLLK